MKSVEKIEAVRKRGGIYNSEFEVGATYVSRVNGSKFLCVDVAEENQLVSYGPDGNEPRIRTETYIRFRASDGKVCKCALRTAQRLLLDREGEQQESGWKGIQFKKMPNNYAASYIAELEDSFGKLHAELGPCKSNGVYGSYLSFYFVGNTPTQVQCSQARFLNATPAQAVSLAPGVIIAALTDQAISTQEEWKTVIQHLEDPTR